MSEAPGTRTLGLFVRVACGVNALGICSFGGFQVAGWGLEGFGASDV